MQRYRIRFPASERTIAGARSTQWFRCRIHNSIVIRHIQAERTRAAAGVDGYGIGGSGTAHAAYHRATDRTGRSHIEVGRVHTGYWFREGDDKLHTCGSGGIEIEAHTG